ncbi:hypothetical protein Q1695_003785 [Nippostrongylus brasiliensis]|nr:hypothetical protein Q1695_003785 [Nippostrongylus brasiliensis]
MLVPLIVLLISSGTLSNEELKSHLTLTDMFTLQLYLLQLLFVVIFSDGTQWTQWYNTPECEYGEQLFCMVVQDIYRRNSRFLSILKDYSNVTAFVGDRERITSVNRRIRIVLQTKEKSALLTPLKEALDAEASALFLLSSGALSNGELKCAYKDVPMVCQRVKSAYQDNIKVAQQLTKSASVMLNKEYRIAIK